MNCLCTVKKLSRKHWIGRVIGVIDVMYNLNPELYECVASFPLDSQFHHCCAPHVRRSTLSSNIYVSWLRELERAGSK
jgi:hypothetical protein